MAIPFVSAAYRVDCASRGGSFGPADDTWLSIAALVEHAAKRRGADRGELLTHAVTLACEMMGGQSETDRLATREWENLDRGPSDPLLLVADRIHYSGASALSAALLDWLAIADESLSLVQRGRILAKRARLEWKAGRIDVATKRCEYLDSLGREAHSDELRARAAIGFVVISQMLGNYPEMHRKAKQAMRHAQRCGLRGLRRDAQLGLMICAATSRRLSDALIHGWGVYELSLGDALEEAESLQNLGQALLDGGLTTTARAVFATLGARRLPARLMLPALGGLALASAKLADKSGTRWAAEEVARIDQLLAPPFALAIASMECAIALQRIGATDEASRMRADSLRLAEAHRFHEIRYRADDLDGQLSKPVVDQDPILSPRAVRVATVLSQMQPNHLPEHAELETTIA